MDYDTTKIMRDAIELGVPPDEALEVAVEVACALASAKIGIVIGIMANLAHLSIQRMAMEAEHRLLSTSGVSA